MLRDSTLGLITSFATKKAFCPFLWAQAGLQTVAQALRQPRPLVFHSVRQPGSFLVWWYPVSLFLIRVPCKFVKLKTLTLI